MNHERNENLGLTAALLGVIVVVLLGGIFGGIAGCGAVRDYGRTQKRKDAENAVKVTHIRIQQAQQQAQIVRAQIAATKARAEQKYQESVGIRRAQDEINKTLTPLYVQHEAIQAMEHGGAAKIYIPSGPGGIPLVNDVSSSGGK